jgi:hypothetical protein
MMQHVKSILYDPHFQEKERINLIGSKIHRGREKKTSVIFFFFGYKLKRRVGLHFSLISYEYRSKSSKHINK